MSVDYPLPGIGKWKGPSNASSEESIQSALTNFRKPTFIIQDGSGSVGASLEGSLGSDGSHNVLGYLPAIYPEWLGDRSFCETHNVRFPYVSGAMANGIATTDIVVAMAKAEMLGFFGSGGLSFERTQEAVMDIKERLKGTNTTWGCNFIHSPSEPELEERVIDMYLKEGVRRISAAAFFNVNINLVQYSASGLTEDSEGNVQRENYIFAKISREETARAFMEPAPADLLEKLVASGKITKEEARLAAKVPVAEDLTAESDSGGHTDNRPLGALFPTLCELRTRIMKDRQYKRPIRIGAAGGIGTPMSAASAFSLGAAYVLTGSVNQSAVESGLSKSGKEMLTHAAITDVIMAPAADMFEMGVELQILRRGTMFAQRGKWLGDLYKKYKSISEIPSKEKAKLEKQVFRKTCDEVWEETRSFWNGRNPEEVQRAESDSHHQMALMFRWYLGLASRWAIVGDDDRKLDYQIWCGPAMGAFNSWVQGSFLEPPESRQVVQIALNILEGAAQITRATQLRSYGIEMPQAAYDFKPRLLK
jgi:trans-AT polyketide synthase, acyltransferase and oxidoreductase domains